MKSALVVGAGGGEYSGAARPGDLDGERAHAAGSAVDQNRLSNLHGEAPHEDFVGRAPASGTAAASSCDSEAGFLATMSAFATWYSA